MAQNFTNFDGSANPNANNTYGELTNSLIFPNTFQFSPGFQQPWQASPGWQNNGQENYTMGNPFQGQMMGSQGYFPIQQDYVAFDEGDDFYNNEEEDTTTGDEDKDAKEKDGLPKQIPGSAHQQTVMSGGDPLASTPPSRAQSQVQGVEQPKAKETPSKTPIDMAAELRARLLAQRRAAGKTPTPEPKTVNKTSNTDISKAGGEKPKVTINTPTRNPPPAGQGRASQIAEKASAFFDSKKDDKSTTKPTVPSSHTSHTSADVDALLAEARDTTLASESIAEPNPVVKQKSENAEKVEMPINGSSHPTPAGKQQPLKAKSPESITVPSRRQSFHNSKASSETSEQGEIREEPKKVDQGSTKNPPEPVMSKKSEHESKPKSQEEVQGKAQERSKDLKSQNSQPKKIDTSFANGRRQEGSAPNSARPKSPPAMKTPATSRPQEPRNYPPSSDYRDLRDSNDRYTPRDRYGESAGPGLDRPQDYDRGRPHMREPQHSYRAPPREATIAANERAAAEYKRNLYSGKPETRDVVMADVPPRQPNHAANQKDLPSENNKPLASPDTAEYYKDLDEWLDWTGYHDKEYRIKQLALRRKMIELDQMRMEIEREAHAGFEARSQLARAQSVRPGEASTVRSTPAPPRFPSFTMPPPPVPSKDELGTQIKDLTTTSTPARSEDALRTLKQAQASSPALTPQLKRQHSGEELDERGGGFSSGKFARTDSRDFSSDKPMQQGGNTPRNVSGSLESRISVDDGSHYRDYAPPRSRSPDYRRRSPSPISRHASGPDSFAGRQFSRGSRNGYSPNRRPDFSRDNSPYNHADGGISYDDAYEANPRTRYPAQRHDFDSRSNAGYDHYGANARGGPQNHNVYRGRGRGRGGRGGYPPYRGAYSKTFDDEIPK